MEAPRALYRDVEQVLLRYCRAIDEKDWNLFASCFTEDAHVDYGRNGVYSSRDPFVEAFDAMHRPPVGATLHRITESVMHRREHA